MGHGRREPTATVHPRAADKQSGIAAQGRHLALAWSRWALLVSPEEAPPAAMAECAVFEPFHLAAVDQAAVAVGSRT